MIIEVSDYFKEKGIEKCYLVTDKQPRRLVIMKYSNGSRKTISYAKYLYESHYKKEVPNGFVVDHINNKHLDDRIDNYQLITIKENNTKGRTKKRITKMICPICGKQFDFEVRNLKSHPNPCCSRRCGGIKSHL